LGFLQELSIKKPGRCQAEFAMLFLPYGL